ncbi:MAG: hypothetical protein NDF55_03545 [archaeon GB-1867-005]|nr:hypothetical protein [Candidatus Culexmicrobium cathedralense]
MSNIAKFEVLRNKPGYVVLSDKSVLTVRVTITKIDELEKSPTGLSLGVGFNVVIAASAPRELRVRVSNKPVPRGGEHLKNLEIWEFVDIVEAEKAVEEVLYFGSDGLKYRVIVEIEPTIVSRTLEYRDNDGNPVYNVRWSPLVLVKIAK